MREKPYMRSGIYRTRGGTVLRIQLIDHRFVSPGKEGLSWNGNTWSVLGRRADPMGRNSNLDLVEMVRPFKVYQGGTQ